VNWWCGSIGAGVRLSREIMKIECATRPLRAGLTCVAPTALGKTNAVGWTPVPRGRIGHPPGRVQDKAKSRSLTAVQELRFLGFRIARSF